MSHSEQDFNDDQISAYLDGELTGPEYDRVVQLVAEHPDYRHTLDDLKSLQSELQLLPRYCLDADFHRRLLRQIDRLPDQTRAQPAPDPADRISDTMAGPTATPRNWRALAWPLLALAATVLVAVYIPFGFWPPGEPELVEAPDSGLPAPATANDKDDATRRAPELGLGTVDEPMVLEDASEGIHVQSGKHSAEAGRAFGRGEVVGADEEATLSAVPALGSRPENRDFGLASRTPKAPAATSMATAPGPAAPRNLVEADDAPAAVDGVSIPNEEALRGAKMAEVEQETEAEKTVAGDETVDMLAFGGYGRRGAMRDVKPAPGDDVAVKSVVEMMGENQVDLIVQVHLAQVDIGKKLFDASLVRNQIVYDESSSATEHLARVPSDSYNAESAPSERSGGVAKPDPMGLAGQVPASLAAKQYSQLQNYELVLVEAPAEQIQATVQELEQNSQQFPDVKLYVSNQLYPPASQSTDSNRGRPAAEVPEAEPAQREMTGQYFFREEPWQFAWPRLQQKVEETHRFLDQGLEGEGRAQRIAVHELASPEGNRLFQRKTGLQQQDHAARYKEPPGSEKNRSDARASSPADTKRLLANAPAKGTATGRPLQVLFLLNQQPTDPSEAAATAAPAKE